MSLKKFFEKKRDQEVGGRRDIWMQVTNMMASKKINFIKAKGISDDNHIKPATTKDDWKITSLFDKIGTQYYTYLLPKKGRLRLLFAASWRICLTVRLRRPTPTRDVNEACHVPTSSERKISVFTIGNKTK